MSAERAWVLVGFLLVSLAYAATQPVAPDEGKGYGGQAYHAMAKAMPRELPPQGAAPYVYRWGMPLAAAAVAKSQDWVITAGFDRLNFAFNALSVLLLTLLLQRHVPSLLARLLVITAFLVEPHSPVRLSYLHPLSADAAAMAGLLACLVAIDWFHARPTPRRAVTVAMLVSAGVLFHEVIVIAGLCVLFMPVSASPARGWRERLASLDRSGAWLPLVAGVATLAAVHAWIVPAPSGYSVLGEAQRWLTEKSPVSYAMAWFLVFGPLLIVPLYFWRSSAAFLRARPAMLVYLVALAVVAWVGDGQTERWLAFASPVVYAVIASVLPLEAMSASVAAVVVAMQALSSRVFLPVGGPIAPPEVRAEVWERLISPNVTWALSYQNMWGQFCAPAMTAVYAAWFTLTSGCMVWLLWRLERGAMATPRPPSAAGWSWPPIAQWLVRPSRPVLVVVGTALAMAPVAWLALSGFYRLHYAVPGPGYFAYNLARLWLVAVMLMVFWSTGSRVAGYRAAAPERWRDRWVDSALIGAATWSVAVVVLAALHLYYLWVVMPVVTIAVALAIADLAASRPPLTSESADAARQQWGLVGILLRVTLVGIAVLILVTIAMWGHFGGDNDVPGNYLPYYEMVMERHSIAPNDYWVHYFASKGNGLAFLANVLSDANGAALATYLVLLLGAGMICRLAARGSSAASAIGLVGACLYLEYYATQGAYAKSHIIRNTLVLYLILSATRALYLQDRDARLALRSKLVVITAIIFLSPLSVALLLPILIADASFATLLKIGDPLRRSLVAPLWAVAATAVVCAYNYFQVGIPELHAMPSFIGPLVNAGRLGQWLDPGLAYVEMRLMFLQSALPAGAQANSLVTLITQQPVWDALAGLWNATTEVFVAGASVIVALTVVVSGWRRLAGTAAAIAFVVFVLALIAGFQVYGGGNGTSMGRFTDFTNPMGIGLGVVILVSAWRAEMGRRPRAAMAVAIAVTAVTALFAGSSSLQALAWRPGAAFFVGANSYTDMHDYGWDTTIAHRVARTIPGNAKVEMLNFLPGFTAIPDTPFQRPDGSAYLKDYTRVLYGPPERVAAIYQSAGIDYFLFDLSQDAQVVWSGFSPLFTPDSIRTRMQLVGRDYSATRNLYLLTWRREGAGEDVPESFLQQWGDKVEQEKTTGWFYSHYDEGLRRWGFRP